MDDHTLVDQLQRRLAAAEAALGEKTALEAALIESRERLHVALASATLGTFVWYVAEDRTEEDAQARVHFGLPQDGTISLAEALATIFHPDDGPRYAAAVTRAIDPAGPGTLQEEYRIRRPDGQERWMSTSAITTFEGTPRTAVRLTGVLADVTDRKRAEAVLQANEDRQAFLLRLGDALRLLADPIEVMAVASEMLGRHLDVGRCGYGEVDETGEWFIVERDWTDGVMPSFVGRHFFDGFGPELVARYRSGRSVLIDDALADARAAGHEAAFEAAGGVRAALGLPLIKEGRFVAGFFVQQLQARHWTAQDEALALDVAERTWAAVERARAEAAMRESQERFTQFAKASSGGIWIRDATTLATEYVSPAIGTIYGVEPDAILGGIEKWAALIVPDDRDIAFKHLEGARQGATAVHEFRIQRQSDGAFRWIRDTNFPLDQNGHVGRIGGLAEDVTDAKLSVEHQGVLLAELQHRVRNIMGMIRSMANRTAPGASGIDDYRSLLEGRLLALARVQALLTREANAGGSLRSIVESEVAAQAHHVGQFELQGPDIRLSPKYLSGRFMLDCIAFGA